MHRVLKSNLKFFIDNLLTITNRIAIMLINQLKIYRTNLAKTKRSISYVFLYAVF